MPISLLVAVADNGVIGQTGQLLPWHLRADLQHFKQLTIGHPIIMGRTTYETFRRPLPGRQNIIVTRDRDYQAAGCSVVHSIDEALATAASDGAFDSAEIFVIGGANIFEQTLPLADKIYLTRVHAQPAGDTFFHYNPADWQATVTDSHTADSQNDYPYSFVTLVRKSTPGQTAPD